MNTWTRCRIDAKLDGLGSQWQLSFEIGWWPRRWWTCWGRSSFGYFCKFWIWSNVAHAQFNFFNLNQCSICSIQFISNLRLEDIPIKNGLSVVFLVFLRDYFLDYSLRDTLVINLLENRKQGFVIILVWAFLSLLSHQQMLEEKNHLAK